MVLWPYHLKKHGNVHCILLLDNCTAHYVDIFILPDKLHIIFLPPNVTNTHQPADMGMISTLKVGYKIVMLQEFLGVFDVEGGYNLAMEARKT